MKNSLYGVIGDYKDQFKKYVSEDRVIELVVAAGCLSKSLERFDLEHDFMEFFIDMCMVLDKEDYDRLDKALVIEKYVARMWQVSKCITHYEYVKIFKELIRGIEGDNVRWDVIYTNICTGSQKVKYPAILKCGCRNAGLPDLWED